MTKGPLPPAAALLSYALPSSFPTQRKIQRVRLEAFCNICSQKYTKVHSETAKAHDSFEFHNGD